MLKKTMFAVAAFLVLALPARAAVTLQKTSGSAFGGYLANEAGLTYNTSYVLDVNQGAGGAKLLSAEVVYGSATYATVSFTSNSYTLNTGAIVAQAHGFTLALPVLYSINGAPAIGGLTDQTTYYVIPNGANSLYLATSSALAQAGTYITLTSSGASANSYTLAPLAIAGTPTFLWQVSNDGSNWVTAPSTGTTTIGSYSTPPAAAVVDFSWFNWRYLKLKVTAPTAGGLFIQAIINGKL